MIDRAKAFAVRGVDAILTRQGFAGAELQVARRSVRDWANARLKARGWRGSIGGLGVIIPRAGRAALVPVEVPLPGRGEITVELLVCAISPGTERAQWLRRPNAQPTLPFQPGYSGAGRVLAVGEGVEFFAEGDLVAVPRVPHASVATIPASWAVGVPAAVEVTQAALVYLAMISGYGVQRAGIGSADPVCVLGSGPIGALAARLARANGAGPLTVVARSRRHEQAAALAGASFRTIDEDLGDIGASVVIDATGDADSIAIAFAAVRDGGRVVLLGSPRGVTKAFPKAELQERRISLVGAHISALAVEARRSGVDPFGEIASSAFDWIARGELRVDDLIGEAIDPREIGLMYRRLADGALHSAHLDWRLLPRSQRAVRRSAIQLPALPTLAGSIAALSVAASPAAARPLRFAAIGCGDIGLSNARAIARSQNTELTLVYDPVAGLAETAAAELGGTAVSTPGEAMDPQSVDAVMLSVPHDLHAPLIAEAAAAGLHIAVEKPLAVDLPSARQAVESARAANVTLSVCFPYRYEAAPAAAQPLVQAGALGALRGATVVFHADKPQSYWTGGYSNRSSSDWRTSARRSGGGVMIMNLTHYVDLLRQFARCEVTEVSASARVEPGQEVEDQIAVVLRFVSGAIATITGSASTRGAPRSRFELWGNCGTLQLEPQPRIYSERSVTGLVAGCWNALPTDEVDVRALFFDRFAAAILDRTEPDVTALDGLAVQAIVDAIYRSVQSGGPERVADVTAMP